MFYILLDKVVQLDEARKSELKDAMMLRSGERLTQSISSPRKPSASRERILEAADQLFYEHGLSVGVDRLIEAANVTRVTFYRYFPAKDDLIDAYLRHRGDRLRERISTVRNALPYAPASVLDAIAQTLVEDSRSAGYRGCEFVNAAAVYPSADHSVQILGVDQRAWLVDVAAEALTELGAPDPERLARKLIMLRSGGTVVLGLDKDDDAGELFLEAWDAILTRDLALTRPPAQP